MPSDTTGRLTTGIPLRRAREFPRSYIADSPPYRVADTNVQVRTINGTSAAVGWSGPRTVTIDRSEEAGGLGIGFSGGELLLMAIGACYTNDLYREAAKRGVKVRSASVNVSGDWGGEPARARGVAFSVRVEASASEAEILALIEHTDKVAEIHNSLRLGTQVTLAKREAVPT